MAAFFRIRGGRAHLVGALAAAMIVATTAGAATAGTLVNVNTNRGTIQIDLFDDLVGNTVDNFLSYVTSGKFSNTLIHRSTSLGDTGLAVIQGGGYNYNNTTGQFDSIDRGPTIPLQYNRANSRGTIAMARMTGVDTASSEWFINTSDNSTTLDTHNGGGYAVFGWVVGPGMTVADDINTLFKKTVAGFGNVPLQNYTNPNPVQQSNLIVVNSVTVVGEHAAYKNPFLDVDVNNDGLLKTSDLLATINDLLAHGGPHAITDPFSGTNYVDVNGSGTVTTSDVLRVINALLAQGSGAAPLVSGESSDDPLLAMAVTPAIMVPEPSSLALLCTATASLAALFLARRRVFRRAAARWAS